MKSRGIEGEFSGSVSPRMAKRESDAVTREQPKTCLGGCRAGYVAAELLECFWLVRLHEHLGVEREAFAFDRQHLSVKAVGNLAEGAFDRLSGIGSEELQLAPRCFGQGLQCRCA